MAQQVDVSVQIGGATIQHFQSLRIQQSLFDHHMFEIQVAFEDLEEKSQFFFKGAHAALVGQPATISFKPRYKLVPADFQFLGVVTELALSNNSETVNTYIIRGHSPTIMMEDGRQRRAWVESGLSTIFGTVAGDYGGGALSFNIAPAYTALIDYKAQYDESNWAFVNRLAAEYGEWCYYDGQTLNIAKPSPVEQEFVIDGVQHFDMAISLKPSKYLMHHYDYKKHKSYDAPHSPAGGYGTFGDFAYAKSSALFGNPAQLWPLKDVGSPGELAGHRATVNTVNGTDLVRFQGSGENPNLTVGMTVNVTGQKLIEPGKYKQESIGKYRIIGISHHVDEVGNYENHFEAVPSSATLPPHNPHVKQPVALPEIATVLKNQDPLQLGRVKLQFHWPNQLAGKSSWVRVAMAYTGGARGSLFIPEINDQVLISYEANHVDFPMVAGSIYHKDPTTNYWSDNNYNKVIRTKGGNKIVMKDKPNEQEFFITNANNKGTGIHISFKGDGTIKIYTKGLVEVTAKDITMDATHDISIHAKNDISISADHDISMSAKHDINIHADNEINKSATSNIHIKSGSDVKIQ